MSVKKLRIEKLGGKWTLWDSVGFPFSFPSWGQAVEWMVKNEPARRRGYEEFFLRRDGSK